MADIRINSLPSTATSFNTDDYIAIDGASGGTRKMLAATLPLTDVTLGGSSGPSVKSTLSARAPRQGLVFDGTAGATVSGVAAFGTSDFTVAAWVKPTTISGNQYLFGGANGTAFALYLNSSGALRTALLNVTDNTASTGTLTAGKWAHVAYVRSSTTGTYYINGIAAGTTTDSQNYSTGTTRLAAGGTSSDSPLTGSLAPLAENRALSASEVVSLYEAGAPAGADYPATVAGTDIVTSGNFSSATGWAVGSAWSISGGVATTNGTADGGGSTELAQTGKSFKAGQRIRVKFTLGNVSAGGFRIIFYGGSANTLTTIRTASGTYTEEVVLAGSATAFQTIASISGVSLNNGATLDDLSIVPLGLLLAPDAAQAGGGLVWYDTSGNAANITLPASGVSWNVPSSRVLGGDWTNAGNLTVTGTGTSTFGGWLKIDFGNPIFLLNESDQVANSKLWGLQSEGSQLKVRAFNDAMSSAVDAAVFTRSGNSLFGTTTDSANGKVQLATHTTSAGGIGFGTDVSFYRKSAALMGLNGSGGAKIDFHEGGTLKGGVGTYAGSMYVVSDTTSPILFYTNASLALTLDSSQNARFAARVQLAKTDGAVRGVQFTNTDTTAEYGSLNYSTGSMRLFANSVPIVLSANNGTTDSLTIDSSSNATFAGTDVTVNGGSTSSTLTLKRASNSYGAVVSYNTTTTNKWFHGLRGLTNDNWYLYNNVAGNNALIFDAATSDATFAGNIKTAAPSGGTAATWRLGTVASVSPTSPNRTIEVEIGGTTYYIHAKTTND